MVRLERDLVQHKNEMAGQGQLYSGAYLVGIAHIKEGCLHRYRDQKRDAEGKRAALLDAEGWRHRFWRWAARRGPLPALQNPENVGPILDLWRAEVNVRGDTAPVSDPTKRPLSWALAKYPADPQATSEARRPGQSQRRIARSRRAPALGSCRAKRSVFGSVTIDRHPTTAQRGRFAAGRRSAVPRRLGRRPGAATARPSFFGRVVIGVWGIFGWPYRLKPESIPDADVCVNVGAIGERKRELRPQPGDRRIDCSAADRIVVAPHGLQEILAGNDPSLVPGQLRQQAEFPDGEREDVPVRRGDVVGRSQP